MQGLLAQAKNGDQVFWEEKFHAVNGKAQACTQRALFFSLLCFGRGGGDVFHIPRLPNVFAVCSFKFPIGSQYVPQFHNVFPQRVIHTISLLSHMPWKMVSSFHLYRCAKVEELYTSK